MWVSIISEDEVWCRTKYTVIAHEIHTTRWQHFPNIITIRRMV